MRARLAVQGHHRPAIRQNLGVVGAQIDHGLDRKNISRLYFGPLSRLSVIWYLGIFVHAAADAMPDILTHNRVTTGFRMLLHRGANVSQVSAGPALLNGQIQTFFGNTYQRQPVVVYLADGNCRGGVSDEPLQALRRNRWKKCRHP